ncbi:MAG: aldolase/citrate lyase family protein [Verrucomicrobia bacterium]|nr:aldolase/citrate lyase family protein [Verrucomicrobiota bacterium]
MIVSTSPFWPKAIGDCGLDFVFIDTEHIAIGRETLSWMCRCYAAMGLPPLVRITDPDPHKATIALDDGAAAVVAPYVESPEQVRDLRGATKLRPLKGQRLKEALDGSMPGGDLATYMSTRNAGNGLIINVESAPAIERLDALLDVDGLDAVLVGPHDLSCSLGIPEQYTDKRFLSAVEAIFQKARSRGIGAGIHMWGSIDEHVRLLNMGANFFIHKADIILFQSHLTTELNQLRKPTGRALRALKGEGPAPDISI